MRADYIILYFFDGVLHVFKRHVFKRNLDFFFCELWKELYMTVQKAEHVYILMEGVRGEKGDARGREREGGADGGMSLGKWGGGWPGTQEGSYSERREGQEPSAGEGA